MKYHHILLSSYGSAYNVSMVYNLMNDLVMVLGMNNMVYDYTGCSLSILGTAYGNSTNDSSSSNGSKKMELPTTRDPARI